MSAQLQAIRGMHDVLPEQAPLWEFFEDSVRDWLRAYGYRAIRMPIVEQTALFVRSIGEATDIVEKEMYSFVDSLNGENLTLRPEGTASCVRAAIEHNLLHNGPQRLYYGGPMFRHERPAKGRYRQFHQVGVEALGYPGPDVDAEHLIMCARLWRSLGIRDVRLEINSLGSLAARQSYRAQLVEYFRARADQLDADSQRRLTTNPLRILDSKNPALRTLIAEAPKLTDHLDEAALEHFGQLQACLKHAQVPFTVNPRLVRGLDYYNFTVSEWVSDHLGAQGTVCAGGRYDGLFEQLGGKPAPACGFAMGVERLLTLIEAQQVPAPATVPHAYVVHQGSSASQQAPLVAEKLRDQGLRVCLHCGGGSFKSQMKKADASGAQFAVIIGEDEVAKNQVSVKPLRVEHEQRLVSLEQAIELMR